MKRVIPLFLILFSTTTIIAQERYQELISDEVSVQTLTYTSKDGENLDMDIYLPEYDAETERATIIYVHGGGFRVGQRDSEDIQKFCSELAKYGYVTASISYRLTRKDKEGGFGCDCPAEDKINTFYAAVEDLQDATFFLIQNRFEFGIDPQKIIIAGSSAGAETVLNTAYQPPYCYGLDSGPVSYAGVIGMAGAIPDTTVIYEESAVPSLLFHGTDDNLVPYATAPHHYCKEGSPGYLILHGSYTITQKLDQLEVPYWLHTSCGAGHEMANKPMKEYLNVITDFCYNYVIKGKTESRNTVVEGKQDIAKYQPYNFCEE
ncbi:alpha/beta hydrolase fold domain-containing protein [Maribellus comscasis]|uniref:Alpha/beta hydrolase fold domain-containing protein n=1 Tax=Maribellus comscasis TaxID=2681766 RepID=A0A6I6JSJ5_9BACT|nr:alpha/beta hydrolase [Maribellus comscasis]QGY45986.1 alpha/beta hydrolase fold domain-containing protein [Maribellus comscasis]